MFEKYWYLLVIFYGYLAVLYYVDTLDRLRLFSPAFSLHTKLSESYSAPTTTLYFPLVMHDN